MKCRSEPEFAGTAAKTFEEKVNKVAFEMKFSRGGGPANMRWIGGQGGPDTVMEEEPNATTIQKLTVGILEWLSTDSRL